MSEADADGVRPAAENPSTEHPAPAAAAEPLSPEREGPFGPIAPGARLTYGWATPLVQLAMYVVSIVPAMIVAIPAAIIYLASSGVDPSTVTPDALPDDLYLLLIVIASVVQFPVWALFAIIWIRGFERRSLASAGFRGPNVLGKYAVGLGLGVAAVIALAAISPFIETVEVAEVADPNLGRLLEPAWLLLIVGAVSFFLVQGSCEEIAFRGWMMSTVAARWGLAMGVAANTLVFGLLHVHVFASGVVSGVASIAAITCVGLFMSLWAIYDRSLAGVCGAHGAFNASAVVLGIIGGAAQSPEAGPGEVLLQTIEQATAMDGEAGVGGGLVQLTVFAAFSGFAYWLIAKRRAREAGAASVTQA